MGLPDKLTEAVRVGDADRVRALLADRPKLLHTHTPRPQPWGEELWLPLHRAATAGDRAMVELLLDLGAQPDSRTRLLNDPSHARATALHLAAEAGHVEVVRLLLDRGASINVRDAQDRTPLHRAVAAHQVDVVGLLIERGAAQDLRDAEGRTPAELLDDEPTSRPDLDAD